MRSLPPPRRGGGVGAFNAPMGPPGPTGSAGPPGPPGPAGAAPNFRGPWSPANAYALRDEVTWLGSSFQMVNPAGVPAGSPTPGADVANWIVTRAGGGVIASSVYGGTEIVLVNNAGADIPGLVLSVPAGAPNYTLRVYGTAIMTTSAANGWGQATLIVQDTDNANAPIKQTTWAAAHPLSGGVARGALLIEEPMPAPGATPRNFKVTQFAILATATVKLLAPGTDAKVPSPRIEAVAR